MAIHLLESWFIMPAFFLSISAKYFSIPIASATMSFTKSGSRSQLTFEDLS